MPLPTFIVDCASQGHGCYHAMMFYAAQALMVQSETAVSKHSDAIAAFVRQFVKTGVFDKTLSCALHRAFDFRQIGDYREMFEVTQQQAYEILRDAERFVQTVTAYFSALPADSSGQS